MIYISRRRKNWYNVHANIGRSDSDRDKLKKIIEKAKLGKNDINDEEPTGINAIAAHGPEIILTESGYKKFFKACKGIIKKLGLWNIKGHEEDHEVVDPNKFNEAPELEID